MPQDSGSIVIEAKIRQKDFDKGIREIEKKLEKLEEKASEPIEINGIKVTGDWNLTEEEQRYYDRLKATLEQLQQKRAEQLMQEGLIADNVKNQVTDVNELSEKYSNVNENVTNIIDHLQELIRKHRELTNDNLTFESDIKQAEQLKKEILETVKQLEKMTGQKVYLKGFTELPKKVKDVRKEIDNVGNSMKKVVKNVIRWGLAIFGVRSAYLFIRQAMSTLAQYDDKLAADLQYIRYALASVLEPIIRRIIELVYKLLQYIGYIAYAWTGRNIFENANKGLNEANKSAKELKKTLAGFDEMNILSNGTGGSNVNPSVDLTQIQGDAPEWIKWIANNGDLVKLILEGIAAALLAIKYNLDLIQGLGLFLMLDGLLSLIKDIKTYLEDKSFSNLGTVFGDLAEILLGGGLLAGLTSMVGIIAAIASQALALGNAVSKWSDHFENVKQLLKDPTWDNFLTMLRSGIDQTGVIGQVLGKLIDKITGAKNETNSLKDAQEELTKVQEALTRAQNEYISSIDNAEAAQKRLEEAQNKTGLSGESLFQLVEQGTLDYKDMTLEQREVYKAYLDNESAQNRLKKATEELITQKQEEEKANFKNRLEVLAGQKQYTEYKDEVVKAFKEEKISASEASSLIEKQMKNISKESRQTFVKDLPGDIKEGLNINNYGSAWDRFKANWKTNLANLVTKVIIPVDFSIGETVINALRKKILGFAKGGIVYDQLPRLATGGVINMPGRGVPIGSAVGGEHGREGVIPLTDSQQMALLGEAIGKYITINANIVNTMNGRVISRELQKINNESDFAFNR